MYNYECKIHVITATHTPPNPALTHTQIKTILYTNGEFQLCFPKSHHSTVAYIP